MRKKDRLVRVPIKILGMPGIALIRDCKLKNTIAWQRSGLLPYLDDNGTNNNLEC